MKEQKTVILSTITGEKMFNDEPTTTEIINIIDSTMSNQK